MNPNTHFQKPDSVQHKDPLRGELSSGLPLFLLPCRSRSMQQRMQKQAGQHKGSALPWLIMRPVSHKCMSQQLVGRLGSLQSSTFLSAHSGHICWMCGVGVQSLQCVQHDWLPRNATLVWFGKERKNNTVDVCSHITRCFMRKVMKWHTGEVGLISENTICTLEVNSLHIICR